jgi:hypothetical protein
MKTILEIARLAQDKIVNFYQRAGENEVNISFCYSINSVDIEIVYPIHVQKLFSELFAMSNQLKAECYIREYKITLSSSKLEVSLIP